MGQHTAIAWTDSTWNPWMGCRRVGLGCVNCYMFRDRNRFGQNGEDIKRTEDPTFYAPIRQTNFGPKVFVCSWSDFFLPEADEWRAEVWGIIKQKQNLIFQILTKRPERILQCLPHDWGDDGYPNVWLGVSVENQKSADKRIPPLLDIPTAVRFVSAEPLLDKTHLCEWTSEGFLDWVIIGGESGPNARPMDEAWVEHIIEECVHDDVPVFFKQWGGLRKVNGAYGGDLIGGQRWQEFPAGYELMNE